MSNFTERFELSQWIWDYVQFYCTMFWTFKGRDKLCKGCSHLLDIQIAILEEQQAGMGSKEIHRGTSSIEWHGFENSSLLSMLIWGILYRDYQYMYIYMLPSFLKVLHVWCGSWIWRMWSSSLMWKKSTIWLCNTGYPSAQETIESHFKGQAHILLCQSLDLSHVVCFPSCEKNSAIVI